MTGTFFAIVGPSGAGKDTLIGAASERLAQTTAFHFPARYINRPADAGGEDHVPVTSAQFAAVLASGGFALSWRAHGLSYGIPADVGDHLARGSNVIVNLSRTVVDAARAKFPRTCIIAVTASPKSRAERLAGRGREDVKAIAARLDRAGLDLPFGPDVMTIDNDGDLETAVRRFMAILDEWTVQARSA